MSKSKEIWEALSVVDVSEKVEKKGNLSFLSWSWAWGYLMAVYPDANYVFDEPIFFNDNTCEVWVTVDIEGVSREMWLPVMDFKNNSVPNPTSRQISDTRMRCLVKCLAMFGLGFKLYSGEDLPDPKKDIKPEYTEEDKIIFDTYFSQGNHLTFYLFSQYVGEKAYIALYNSFPTAKVKSKEKCDNMTSEGLIIAGEIAQAATEMVANDDPAWNQDLGTLSDKEKIVMGRLFSPETLEKIKLMKEQE